MTQSNHKLLGAVAVLGMVAMLASGCTSDRVEKPNETTAPAVELCTVDNNTEDDVVPVEAVTDEYGVYCSVALDPDSDATLLNSKIFDAAQVTEYAGMTPSRVQELHEAYINHLVDNIIDTPLLDTTTLADPDKADYLGFFESNLASLIAPEYVELYRTHVTDNKNLDRSGLTVSDYFPMPLNRNGEARMKEMTLKTYEVYGAPDSRDGTPVVVFKTKVTVKFDTSEKETVNAIIRNGRATLEEIEALQPSLLDGKDDDGLVLEGEFNGTYNSDGKIYGSNTSYQVTTNHGFRILD